MLKGIFDDVLPDQLRDSNHVMYGPPSHKYGLTVDSSPKYTNFFFFFFLILYLRGKHRLQRAGFHEKPRYILVTCIHLITDISTNKYLNNIQRKI